MITLQLTLLVKNLDWVFICVFTLLRSCYPSSLYTHKLSMASWLAVYLPASSGSSPGSTFGASVLLASLGTRCSGVTFHQCALLASVADSSQVEALLFPSPGSLELGSSYPCIKHKAVEGKCSRTPQQLLSREMRTACRLSEALVVKASAL